MAAARSSRHERDEMYCSYVKEVEGAPKPPSPLPCRTQPRQARPDRAKARRALPSRNLPGRASLCKAVELVGIIG